MDQKNEFKTTDSLFSKIKEDFASFNSSGLIDSGRFFSDVKYILSLLGKNWYVEKQIMLDVENYKVALPDDFQQLDFAYKCSASKELPKGVVMTKQTFDHYPLLQDLDWHSAHGCEDTCYTPPTNCIFNSFEQILVTRGDDVYCYSNPVLLKLGNIDTKRCCVKNCVNMYATCTDTISIQNSHIYTNFERGSIYLSYNAFPVDEETGLPLIPDNVRIEKCIEYYIKKNIIESLWVNSDADVAQKVPYFNQQYMQALGDAQYETKLPTFNRLVEQVRRNRKRLDIYYQIE